MALPLLAQQIEGKDMKEIQVDALHIQAALFWCKQDISHSTTCGWLAVSVRVVATRSRWPVGMRIYQGVAWTTYAAP